MVVGLLVVAHLGAAASDRAAARTAADAAALAAAAAGQGRAGGSLAFTPARAAAEQAARRNGAILESVAVDGNRAEVVVRVGRSSAAAAATALDP